MFSLIFPPIFVIACILLLVQIFWKKKHLFSRSTQKSGVSFRVKAPRSESGDATVSDSNSEEHRIVLGDAVKGVIGASVSFLSDSLLRPLHRAGAEWRRGKKRSVYDADNASRKEKSATGEELRYGSEQGEHGRKERSMISDTITLPQKQEEKNEYEQVLIERIAMNPRDVEAYERLGDYYLEIDALDDAKECFKQVLRLSPLSRRARFRMRRVEKLLSGR